MRDRKNANSTSMSLPIAAWYWFPAGFFAGFWSIISTHSLLWLRGFVHRRWVYNRSISGGHKGSSSIQEHAWCHLQSARWERLSPISLPGKKPIAQLISERSIFPFPLLLQAIAIALLCLRRHRSHLRIEICMSALIRSPHLSCQYFLFLFRSSTS